MVINCFIYVAYNKLRTLSHRKQRNTCSAILNINVYAYLPNNFLRVRLVIYSPWLGYKRIPNTENEMVSFLTFCCHYVDCLVLVLGVTYLDPGYWNESHMLIFCRILPNLLPLKLIVVYQPPSSLIVLFCTYGPCIIFTILFLLGNI